MPNHKITGLLHNCALNCALPTLLDGIDKLAEREAAGTLDDIATNPIVESYSLLKNLFARHYGVAVNADFNWQAFNAFIKSHSFYGTEILFAPVFRLFIAEKGPANGYLQQDLGLLRDVRDDGRYALLDDREGSKLFYSHFGILSQTYEFIAGRKQPEDNYERVSSMATDHLQYPFGDVSPLLKIYLKDAHFEIHPHESLKEATLDFIREVNELTPELAEIHNGLSSSDSADESNCYLAKLLVYVRKTLTLAASVVQAEPTKRQKVLTTAAEYARTGRDIHGCSVESRQTFAVILLTILCEDPSSQDLALTRLELLNQLAMLARVNQPLAAYYQDQLASAIIDSEADLQDTGVASVVAAIDKYNKALIHMTCKTPLIQAAHQTIQLAWQMHQDTGEKRYVDIIERTQAVVMNPTQENIAGYNNLRKDLEGKGNLYKKIAGFMLTVIGLALIAGGFLGLVGSLGLSVPVSATVIGAGVASIAAGIGFFRSSRDTGLYKEARQFSNVAEAQLVR